MSSKAFFIALALAVAFAFSGACKSLACTVFLAVDGNTVLAGNNEDWHIPLTKLWFLPAQQGKHGVVYVTFSDHRAIQGGMNDRGLIFDFLAVKPRDVKLTPDKLRWKCIH